MRKIAKAQPLELTQDQHNHLEAILRTRTIQAQIMNRSRIILLKADGTSVDVIVEKVGLNRNIILLCLKKFKEGGVENAIYNTPGRGLNPEITDDEKTWIFDITYVLSSSFAFSFERMFWW